MMKAKTALYQAAGDEAETLFNCRDQCLLKHRREIDMTFFCFRVQPFGDGKSFLHRPGAFAIGQRFGCDNGNNAVIGSDRACIGWTWDFQIPFHQ